MSRRPPCLTCGRPLPAVYRSEYSDELVADTVCSHRAFVAGASVRCELKPELVDGRSVCAAGHVEGAVTKRTDLGKRLVGYGRSADGAFCTDTCGIRFARAAVKAGYRLTKKPSSSSSSPSKT